MTAASATEQEHLTHELRRHEAYLAEAQRLSHTGSFGWRVSTGELLWSEETFRIFQYDRTTKPTLELVFQRVHPEDVALVREAGERAWKGGKAFDLEHRLLMPGGSVRYVHVVAHALQDESGSIEYVGAVMDVTDQRRARAALEKAVDALRKSQERLRFVIDAIPGMVWSARPDGSVDFVNQPWVEYHGLSLEDLGSQGLRAVIHPEDWEESAARWRAALAAGTPSENEIRARRADGEYRWFMSRAVPLRDELGHIVKWYGTITDIEDRKRAEMLLAGERQLLEMIARGDSLALILDALCRLAEELSSGSLSSILLLDPKENSLRHGAAPSLPIKYTEAIDGGVIGPSAGSCGTAAWRAEPVIVTDIANDPLWADYRELALAHRLRACWSRPILSSHGKVLGTFANYYREPRSPTPREYGVLEQIASLASIAVEREQEQEVLREHASLLDLTHDTIFVRDMSDVITYWNRGAEELYGWTRADVCGRVSHQLMQTTFPAPLDEVKAELLRTDRWEGELVNQKRDGTRIVVASRWSLQRNKQGRPAAILETNNDISGRKRAEAELRQAQADLAQVSRVTTMGELTASLAHEVSQPIAGAITNANACLRWLAGDIPNLEEARTAAIRIVRDGTRAADIIGRIRLLFTKGAPQRELVDVNEVIREMTVLLRSETTRFSILVRTTLATDLPQVMGDRVQLQQVMMNLIMNSIDAMKEVDGTRELAIHSQRAEHEQLLVSVSDTGVGLPPQQQDQIFNAFFTSKLPGTGMGLPISRSILEAHGGRLWATDHSPRGASFFFTLPTPAEADE